VLCNSSNSSSNSSSNLSCASAIAWTLHCTVQLAGYITRHAAPPPSSSSNHRPQQQHAVPLTSLPSSRLQSVLLTASRLLSNTLLPCILPTTGRTVSWSTGSCTPRLCSASPLPWSLCGGRMTSRTLLSQTCTAPTATWGCL
jgi:hypothetical protein